MKEQDKKQLRAGVVGTGAISGRYIGTIQQKFPIIQLVSICARDMDKAKKKAGEYGLKACTYSEMLADGSIDMVINLTPAHAHYEIIKQALLAGKHVYSEKTMTDDPEKAHELAALAEEKQLYLGCAPDTFLGAAVQTAKKAIEDGLIGEVTSFYIAASRYNPLLLSMFSFLRAPGGGICYDYAVYHMTALVSLLGPVEKVGAVVRAPYPTQKNMNPNSPEFGQMMDTPNESQIHVVMQLKNKIAGTVMVNADSIVPDTIQFAIYGTKGILYLPDSSEFGGDVLFREHDTDLLQFFLGQSKEFPQPKQPVKLTSVNEYEDESRGIGAADLAEAILEGRQPRASKELAVHVLDVLDAVLKSGETGEFVTISSGEDI